MTSLMSRTAVQRLSENLFASLTRSAVAALDHHGGSGQALDGMRNYSRPAPETGAQTINQDV